MHARTWAHRQRHTHAHAHTSPICIHEKITRPHTRYVFYKNTHTRVHTRTHSETDHTRTICILQKEGTQCIPTSQHHQLQVSFAASCHSIWNNRNGQQKLTHVLLNIRKAAHAYVFIHMYTFARVQYLPEPPSFRVCICTQAVTHTCTHSHIHTCVYTESHMHVHMHSTHTYSVIHAVTQTRTHNHTHVHVHI